MGPPTDGEAATAVTTAATVAATAATRKAGHEASRRGRDRRSDDSHGRYERLSEQLSDDQTAGTVRKLKPFAGHVRTASSYRFVTESRLFNFSGLGLRVVLETVQQPFAGGRSIFVFVVEASWTCLVRVNTSIALAVAG